MFDPNVVKVRGYLNWMLVKFLFSEIMLTQICVQNVLNKLVGL